MANANQYGMLNPTVVNESQLVRIDSPLRKYPDYRLEVLKRLNGGVFSKLGVEVNSHKIDWSAQANKKMRSELASQYTTGNSFSVRDAGVFNVDDVIQVGDAQAVVTAVDSGVVVYFDLLPGESAIGTKAIGTPVFIVSGGTPHGKDADDMISRGFDDYFNYAGNFEDVVNASDIYQASKVRGLARVPKQISDKKKELMFKLNVASVFGRRGKDNVKDATYMGGYKDLIDTYAPENAIDFGGSSVWNDPAADRMIQDKLDAVFAKLSDSAFEKPVMWVGPKFMAKFKHIQTDYTYTADKPSGTRGVGVVRKYLTHTFGEIDVVQLLGMGPLMDDFVAITDESDLGLKPLIPWSTRKLGASGQSDKWQVTGVYHFLMGLPETHYYLHNLGLEE